MRRWLSSSKSPKRSHDAHLSDIVHRDIKPGNILLDKNGKAYLADFGVAITEDELLEEHGAVSGTLAYMSPEQVSGNSLCVNARTDIYSLGVVLYELLTGRLPFKAKTFDGLRKCIISGEPRTPRTIDDAIPLDLETVCLKAMSKRVSDRFSTAGDMANGLRNILGPASPPVPDFKLPAGALAVEKLAKQLGVPVPELILKVRENLPLEIFTPTSILTAAQVSRLMESLFAQRWARLMEEVCRWADGIQEGLNVPWACGVGPRTRISQEAGLRSLAIRLGNCWRREAPKTSRR